MLFFLFLGLTIYLIYVKLVEPGFYWKRKNIFHVQPWKRFVKIFLTSRSFYEKVIEAYNEFPERRYFGSYQFLAPSLVVRDLELVKRITVQDFEYFPDHLSMTNDMDLVLGQNLFSLKGQKWKDMRSTLSPAFTGSKMRAMYDLIKEIAENFAEHFYQKDENVVEVEMKNIFSKYTNDVIASCAFGITCNSLKDENNDFFKMGSAITGTTPANVIRGMFLAFFPKASEFFRIPTFPSYITNFFRKIVKDTITLREKENVVRPDMIHLLMEARKGRLNHETDKTDKESGFATVEESSTEKAVTRMELTDDVVTAQALVFFVAGFETTSTILSFLAYELALNPDIQSKLQNEIDSSLSSGNGDISYEGLLKMKYLDQVISETLRKYPPGYVINRISVKDYEIKAQKEHETDVVLDKGCLITIPVCGFHMDPHYFPDPYKFNPDRFSDENKGNIVPGTYMPFGSGPRNCIGSRFALLEAKTLTVSLFSKFDVVPIEKTTIPIKFAKTINVSVKNGFWLGLKKRNMGAAENKQFDS